MEDKAVIWSKDQGVCTVTINSPRTLNAISSEVIQGLEEAFEDCLDAEIRAVVLTGAGKAFCSGGDIPGAVKTGAQQWLFQNPKRLAMAVSTIRKMPKPVLASVNGSAWGVGMSIAMACDLRIAADNASFVQAYTSVGLSPDGGWTMTVPRIVGVAKALEMALLDRPINAEEALRLGLVSKVVPAADLADETAKMAKKLANGPTLAFAATKTLINNSVLQGIEGQMEQERWSISNLALTEDFMEGYEALFNKRKPNYKGK